MLPKGWKRSTLGECTKLLSGNTPSKERQDYWSGDFPWATVKDMKTPWLHRTGLTLTQAGKAAASVAPANSILVVTRGMALLKDLPISLAMRDVAFNQDIKAVVPKDGLDARFLAYQLQSKKHVVLDMVDTAGHGTGKLDTDLLKSVDLVLPPIPEQRRIAQILSTWDQAITTAERLLANSEQQKRALVSGLMFGRKRLSGFVGIWCNAQLQKVCSLHKGSALSKADISHDGKNACILYGELFTIYAEEISQVRSRTSSNQGFLAKKGDVLMPTATTTVAKDLAKASVLMVEDVLVGGDAIIIRPREEVILGEFLAYLMTYAQKSEILARAQGATIVHLSAGDLTDINLCFPSIDEQKAICNVLRKANIEIRLLKRYVERLNTEKAALMSQLLTGKRRVKLPDAETEVQA